MPKFRLCGQDGEPVKMISVKIGDDLIKADGARLFELSLRQAEILSQHYRVIGQSGREINKAPVFPAPVAEPKTETPARKPGRPRKV